MAGRLRAVERLVHSVQGEALLKVTSAQGTGATSMLVAADERGRFHLEVLDFFGRPISIVVSDGQALEWLDLQANILRKGPANAATLARVFTVGVEPRDLSTLLLGRVPRLEEAVSTIRFDADSGTYPVALTSAGGASAAFADFRLRDGVDWPHRLVLKVPSRGTQGDLTYRDVSLNVPLGADLFTLDAPPNATVQGFDDP